MAPQWRALPKRLRRVRWARMLDERANRGLGPDGIRVVDDRRRGLEAGLDQPHQRECELGVEHAEAIEDMAAAVGAESLGDAHEIVGAAARSRGQRWQRLAWTIDEVLGRPRLAQRLVMMTHPRHHL